MNKEFVIENGIAHVYYDTIKDCLADNSKETKKFLRSTPCKKAKVAGSFCILRRSKRGLNYILIYCNDYNIEFESGNAEKMEDLSKSQIKSLFNPEVLEAQELIYNISDRKDMNLSQIRKIYKKGISRARNIEYIENLDFSKLYRDILPDFLQTKSCRTKVFITPDLRSKMGD